MYNGITSKGSQYLAKCQAEGLPIKLSKVKIGNGTIQDLENPYNFTDIKSIKQEFEISEKSQVEEQLKIKVQIDNTSLEEGYFTKEIGIYADDNGQEILYWYINDGDQASWLPPASVSPVKFKYTFNIQVTTTETVIVNFTGKELWVDREFLNTELVKKLDKGTVPNSLNTAEKIVAALQGNGGLKFDENLLYLNDKGTKKKGVYYLDRLAEGIFECLEQTEETVNNSAKFKNISNKENSDRLDNLFEINDINANEKFIIINSLYIRFGNVQFNNYVTANHRYRVDLPNNYNIISVQATQKGANVEEQISNNIGYDQYAENIIQFFWRGTQVNVAMMSYIILAIIN
ncbi:hypothetical protein [Fusobacterium sp. HC1336]|uniref:hypothetical protein n=1 Tax=Fusobacterium sp. HC1336 TaxID=3171169 RepID=UPI003F1F751D